MARRTFLLLAIGVLVLSACGGGAGDGAEVTTPGVSASSPVATGERVLVSGTTVCDFTSEITENTHGPVSTFTGTMACTDEASDPRVSGRDEFELHGASQNHDCKESKHRGYSEKHFLE